MPTHASESRAARATGPLEAAEGAGAFLPRQRSLAALREAVQRCRGCGLYANATQAVFGRGARSARLVLVGEQPGNEEDLRGEPFVGPAGRVLDEALAAVGLDPASVYITNAVKHFKWEARGKRRLHSKPGYREVTACRPWLEAELELLGPEVLVCMGATAAQSLLGREFRVSLERGRPRSTPWCRYTLATLHPSAVLRQRTRAGRAQLLGQLVEDLTVAAELLGRRREEA